MARDDFRRQDIATLQQRVAHRCSNPECRHVTLGPGVQPNAVTNVGIAAHIHAASPGGPRYLPEMTTDERRGIDNGIWLCSNCATLVDRDVHRFPADVLHGWKRQAEDQARREQGQRLPEASDAVDLLTTALNRTGTRFIPHAISNVHAATAASLAQLDPRFHVESEFSGGRTRFTLRAQEPVQISVRVAGDSVSAWAQGLMQVLTQGRTAVLPMKGVTFVGSKLLEAMHDNSSAGTLTVLPVGRDATLRVFAPDQRGDEVAEEMQGIVSAGRNAMHFEGSGCGGTVKIEMGFEINNGGEIQGRMKLLVDFSVWEGIDVRQPPYLDKVYRLLQCLVPQPAKMRMHLEIEGEHVLTGTNTAMGDPDLFRDALNFAVYTRHARTVARNIGRAVLIRVNLPFSAADHLKLAEAAETFEGKRKYDRTHLPTPPSFTLLPTDGGQQMNSIVQNHQFQELQLRYPEQKIVIFGLPVVLPPLEFLMHSVRLVLPPGKKVVTGKKIKIKTELGPDFRCEYRFA